MRSRPPIAPPRRVRRSASAGRIRAALTAAAVGVVIVASPAASIAASSTPTGPAGSASPGPAPAGVAWLDAAVPRDAPVGSTITIGATLVEVDSVNLVAFATPAFRLRPASGGAPATVAIGLPDWRGHFVAHVEVPAGGPGALTIGLPGTSCSDAGCTAADWPFEIRVGPPIGLPLPFLTTADLVLSDSALMVGGATTVEVDLTPRVAWPQPLALPDQLVLEVREVQGPTVAEVPLDRDATGGGRYTASLSLDRPGDYVAQVAAAVSPTEDDLWGTAIRRLTVTGSTEPSIPAPGASPGLPDWWPLGLAAIGLILAALLVIRGRSAETPGR